MPYILEETLKYGDLPPDLKPWLVYQEVLEALRPPRVFAQSFTIDRSLIGQIGTKIRVPEASSLSASSATEATIDNTGFTKSDKTITDSDLDIGNVIYCAGYLSRILREDAPNIDWVRLQVRNQAEAVLEKQDSDLRDALIAGAGNTAAAATAGTLDFDDIVDGIATMESAHVYPSPDFYLIVHPNNAKDIVKDTRFYDTKRYALGNIPFPAGEVGGLTAGCRVFKTSNMVEDLALIVAPPTHPKAPFAIKGIKRPLTLKTEAQEQYEKDMFVTTMRYGTCIPTSRADGIYLISNC